MEQLKELLPFLIPLIIAQVIVLIITVRHILTHENYKRGNRLLWIVVAVVGMQFWGAALYFILGKEDE